MASRYIGRAELQISRKICSATVTSQPTKGWTRKYASSDGPSTNSASSSSVQLERDPSLPPKPPAGTYPHPFPNSRDDPHSNSMRVSYQPPASMSQRSSWQSPHIPAGTSAFSRTANYAPSADRWADMNAAAGIDSSAGNMLRGQSLPPLYVIHIKATSNNTIITLHAPSTPKSQTIAKPSARNSPKNPVAPSAYSVESNPDAVPPELDMGASEPSESVQSAAESLSNSLVQPTVADLPPSSSFTPATANRCIGWASGGSCHYKKVNRSTYEAGYAASVRIIRRVEEAFEHLTAGARIEDLPPMKEVKGAMSTLSDTTRAQGTKIPVRLRVVYTGFGTGREAFNAAVLSADGAFVRNLIVQVQDKTPIKVGGCRGKKARRV